VNLSLRVLDRSICMTSSCHVNLAGEFQLILTQRGFVSLFSILLFGPLFFSSSFLILWPVPDFVHCLFMFASWFHREFLVARRLAFNVIFYGIHLGLFAYGWYSQVSSLRLPFGPSHILGSKLTRGWLDSTLLLTPSGSLVVLGLFWLSMVA
jgi:hypothetical protein